MSKGVNVENYPGIYEASGGDIIKLMKRQAMRFSATFEEEAALSVDLSSRPFKIVTNASTIYAHSLVVATGADSRWLGVPGEEDLKGGGVSSCATCDGFLFGKPVVVVAAATPRWRTHSSSRAPRAPSSSSIAATPSVLARCCSRRCSPTRRSR